MDTPKLKKIWEEKYKVVPGQLEKIKKLEKVATGFNTNIDAVCRLDGKRLKEIIETENVSLEELQDIKHCRIENEKDFLKGVFKCFSLGIAEEWICENEKLYEWIQKMIGYDHLQIGGQGGIIANVLSSVGIKKVYVHTNSLPKIQAEQFLQNDNLVSFDEKGDEKPAYLIDRKSDPALIHFIIEFKRGDIVELEGKTFRCPRANRFIATYDPLNLHLVLDERFMSAVEKESLDFAFLSGFHALLEKDKGIFLIEQAAVRLKNWKKQSPQTIFHLEIASTQDLAIRKSIVDQLAVLVDSIGINERETMDLLEVIDQKDLLKLCQRQTTSENLLKAMAKIKEKTGVKRIQLHMFGIYMCLQDKDCKITPEENLKGMLTASVVAASKAKTGSTNPQEIKNVKYDVSDVGLIELDSLSIALGQPDLTLTGIGRYRIWDLVVVPTILIENPLTLVGMGDTISSLSLVSAR